MKEAKFSVPGEPKGKGRPRFTVIGGKISTYTPKETRDYEDKIRECYILKYGEQKLSGLIKAEIVGYFRIPSSIPKNVRKDMMQNKVPPRIDCDNIAKSVLDALNKVAYDDDRQIMELFVKKKFSSEPHISVVLTEIQ